jgi:hypothetical protein
VELDAPLQKSTEDDIDMSTPSLNTSTKFIKITLEKQQAIAWRRYILRSIARLPSIEELECKIHKEQSSYNYCDDGFIPSEIERHFVAMRKHLNLQGCRIRNIKE